MCELYIVGEKKKQINYKFIPKSLFRGSHQSRQPWNRLVGMNL